MSQPTKRTPAVAKAICECLTEGLSLRTTVAVCGVSLEHVWSWRKEDPEFAAQMKKAVSDGERALVATVRGGNTNSEAGPAWTSASWLLSRRFPERWGKKREEHKPVAPGSKLTGHDAANAAIASTFVRCAATQLGDHGPEQCALMWGHKADEHVFE